MKLVEGSFHFKFHDVKIDFCKYDIGILWVVFEEAFASDQQLVEFISYI